MRAAGQCARCAGRRGACAGARVLRLVERRRDAQPRVASPSCSCKPDFASDHWQSAPPPVRDAGARAPWATITWGGGAMAGRGGAAREHVSPRRTAVPRLALDGFPATLLQAPLPPTPTPAPTRTLARPQCLLPCPCRGSRTCTRRHGVYRACLCLAPHARGCEQCQEFTHCQNCPIVPRNRLRCMLLLAAPAANGQEDGTRF